MSKKCIGEDRLVEKVVDVVSHISVHYKRLPGLQQVLVKQRQWRDVHMLQVHEKKFLIEVEHASHFQQMVISGAPYGNDAEKRKRWTVET